MPEHLLGLLKANMIADIIGLCDSILYKVINFNQIEFMQVDPISDSGTANAIFFAVFINPEKYSKLIQVT